MRSVACLLVVLMHITRTFSDTFHTFFLKNIFDFGGSGVDIFFVLSGFIITYSNRQYITKAAAIPRYITKRIIRIFPTYWIIITIFLMIQLLLPAFYRTHFPLSFNNLLRTCLLLPNHIMVDGVSWSLTNELFFYALFILALLIPKNNYILFLLFAYLIFLIVFPFTSLSKSTTGNDLTDLLIFPMNIEFLLGILVIYLLDSFPVKYCKPVLGAGILLFIVGAILADNNIVLVNSTYNRIIIYGFPSFLMILGLVKYENSTPVIVNKILLLSGDASYAIYLFHLPLVAAFFKLLQKLPVSSPLLLTLMCFGLIAFIYFLGIIIYKKIESPIIKWCNVTFLGKSKKSTERDNLHNAR